MRRISILMAAAVASAAAVAIAIPSNGAGRDIPASSQGHGATGHGGSSHELATAIARARFALGPFATDLRRARTHGYKLQITQMMPDMGYHYMDPDVKGFDVRRPPILVYVRRGKAAQLVAAEWVFPSTPAKPPLPGARYGSFAAACHYVDGTFTPQDDEAACAPKSPDSGAAFTFWHPGPGHDAPVAVVPEPRGRVQLHKPAHLTVQQRLNAALSDT
jgi:hypothetical protein